MTRVEFYKADADGGRTVAGLVREALENKMAALLRVVDEKQEDAVSEWLWKQDGFLAHGTRKHGYAERQPVYVSADLEAPNRARWLLLLDEASLDWSKVDVFERVGVVIGKDPRPARKLWKAAVAAGLEPKMMVRGEGDQWVVAHQKTKRNKEESN